MTPAAARALLDGARDTSAARGELAFEREALRDAAPDLAETVASEPERIVAARNALRAEVAAALAAFVESDHAVNRALAAGEIRDEYHPTLFARLARLDALRGLLTPETTT